MKIIAEFNSVSDIKEFIGAFGVVGATPIQVENVIAKAEIKEETKTKKVTAKKEDKVQAPKEESKEETEIVEDKKAEEETPVEIKDAEVKTVTKEDVLNACKVKMTEGKTAQVKAITSKFGAKNVSSIKEEDYEAILAELGVI